MSTIEILRTIQLTESIDAWNRRIRRENQIEPSPDNVLLISSYLVDNEPDQSNVNKYRSKGAFRPNRTSRIIQGERYFIVLKS